MACPSLCSCTWRAVWSLPLPQPARCAPACRRRPDPTTPPRCLRQPGHWKDQSCLRLLPLHEAACLANGSGGGNGAGACSAAAVCCITGGEDAQLRQHLLPLQPLAAAAPCAGMFAAAQLLTEQVAGAAVKALALLPLPSASGSPAAATREWLLLSAGARRTLLACRLREQPQLTQQQPSGRSQAILCEELSSTGPEMAVRAWRPCAAVSWLLASW